MTVDEKKKKYARYIKAEKLRDLRTKQEIELMNGRPWTRELPPPPVLPPYGPLEKISGRLDSFSSEPFKEYFDVKAYRINPLPEVSDSQLGRAAAMAIAVGSPGLGSVMMSESDSVYDSAEYVQGQINGKPFRGWVGRTRLQAGDKVEMAVDWQHDHYEVYAITLPKEGIISICPKCDMGHISHVLWRVKNMFFLTALLFFAIMLVVIIHSVTEGDWKGGGFIFEYWWLFVMALGINLSIAGLIAFAACRAYIPTICRFSEEIFKVLGMKNPSRINLNRTTKQKELHLKDIGEWHDPEDLSKPLCPTQKFVYSAESWFYY
ncbi:hypothetical protein MUU47_21905 [Scandinavium sp. H11S7]|uniref:Uncharacterized protein n=1 Tax=Scandinavium hiltneri TaxID=2926519 RepID=A0ABT2E756_9ENTR|nr:putative type VI secretion system effector [Scandinavium hiltneri]MCS2163731.1 hypothetical protein [Scandinavium hiltneri]